MQELLLLAERPLRHGVPSPRAQVPHVTHSLDRDVVLLHQRPGCAVARRAQCLGQVDLDRFPRLLSMRCRILVPGAYGASCPYRRSRHVPTW